MAQDDMIDSSVWSVEAQYVHEHNPLAFQGGAYGYPGGPVIDGTIAIHDVSGLPYHSALLWFLTLFDSVVIALCCGVAYLLRKDLWWPVGIFTVLSLSPMFQYSTPTTACSAVLAVLLCLLTLYIIENKSSRSILLSWGILAGMMLSVRIDAALVMIAVFGYLVGQSVGWRKLIVPALSTLVTFCILDPFIWIMPSQHISDLILRIVNGYVQDGPFHVPVTLVMEFSILALVSMIFAGMTLKSKENLPLPRRFTVSLLGMTALFYAVFLTSHSQALRYYQPIIFIWEALLPLLLFHFISTLKFGEAYDEAQRNRAEMICRLSFMLCLVARSLVTFCAWWIL